ncbi:MAG TPA: hypothetical protein DCE71_08750 [Parachlamydiales bacterium]|nr:hypothetical protein [Parachlamydiales bacterium]
MINLNIQLPKLIDKPEGYSAPILRYDDGLEVTSGIKTEGRFQNFIMMFQNWFDSSKQWVPVQTREGKIVYLQKSKAAFDRNDKSRPEVIEALYVEKVWKASGKVHTLDKFGYASISARKMGASMLNDGYLLRNDGTILIEEKSKGTIADGANKKMQIVVDMETGKRLARLIVKRNKHEPEGQLLVKSSRLQNERIVLNSQLGEGSVKVEGDYLMKTGKASILEELFDASLPDNVKEIPGKIRNKWKSITEQLIYGLEGIHQAKVSHNDIKGPNILIREEAKGNFKAVFADFEFSSAVTGNGKNGTLFYYSPEKALVYNNFKTPFPTEKGYKADVWALGLELYRLHHGEYPEVMKKVILKARTKEEQAKLLANLQQNAILKEPRDKNSFDYLVWKMLQVNPEERFTMSQVRQHWDRIKGSL